MKKSRGRPPKHWAEKARVITWYYGVKRRTDWSDHKLDIEFAWPQKNRADRDAEERPRMFERIRTSGTTPSRGNHWRSTLDLIQVVEEHDLFKGTKEIYEAELWDFLKEDTPTLIQVKDRLTSLLNRCDLISLDASTSPHLAELAMKLGSVELYEQCLNLSLKRISAFDQITLLWVLYRLTDRTQNWQIRSFLESTIDKWADLFFSTYLPYDQYCIFYYDSIETLINGRMDPSTTMARISFLEFESRKVILPRELENTVIEEILLSARKTYSY